MMKSLAPLALTGIAGIILWKILQILMAPVIAWILGVLAIGLTGSIGLALVLARFREDFHLQVIAHAGPTTVTIVSETGDAYPS